MQFTYITKKSKKYASDNINKITIMTWLFTALDMDSNVACLLKENYK